MLEQPNEGSCDGLEMMAEHTMMIFIIVALSALTVTLPQPICRPPWHGAVSIVNYLSTNLYVRSVSVEDGPLHILPANEGRYNETWRPTVNSTGVSIKIATSMDMTDVLQFEYSAIDPTIYWDVSCINLSDGSRLIAEGFTAIASDKNCQPVVCDRDDDNCPDVYHEPDDNYAIRGCPINTTIVMQIGSP
ncbi:hypothetical protein IFM53868_10206 [Aspergillus udagawae]|uniref:Uncharacterized protein n=1 Tax=Aspergillus udagawae TaxID=91492 RepID=A0ABQ1BDJ7_9EURO|nr:hypothetical protein IFM53868_10206 [Aspergillus udagawae]